MQADTLPHSNQTEITVLGAMMTDRVAVFDATAALSPEDFALDSHQRIYRVMQSMMTRGEGVDIITVMNALQTKGELDAIGGAAYLAFLSEGIPRNPQIEAYVKKLKSATVARRAISAYQMGIQRLMEQTDAPESILGDVERLLAAERNEETVSGEQAAIEGLELLKPGGYTKIPTGIPEIDKMTYGGGRTKELWIIGAQPSAGKSALCRQIERNAMRLGFGVHSHSVEVSRAVWQQQHMARLADIPAWKLRVPEVLSDSDHDNLKRALIELSRWNYRIDEAGGVGIDALIAKSRLSVMRHGVKVVTVDYLQLLQGDPKFRATVLSEAARRLKQFAKDYDCLVIALSQLARQGDINIRPTVQHLKESGDLEAAADVVILNYRPKNEAGEYTGEDELIVGKQRSGGVGAIKQFFNTDKLEFESRAY